jgi:hypothetical protein
MEESGVPDELERRDEGGARKAFEAGTSLLITVDVDDQLTEGFRGGLLSERPGADAGETAPESFFLSLQTMHGHAESLGDAACRVVARGGAGLPRSFRRGGPELGESAPAKPVEGGGREGGSLGVGGVVAEGAPPGGKGSVVSDLV